jgi:MFS transporter, ACS family, glucarate transporter
MLKKQVIRTGGNPTKIRWAIMTTVMIVTVLTYLDRLNVSVAGKYIQDEFSLSTQTMGWIFSAFLLGYSLFQIPGGWAGDRYGPKHVLTITILLWSFFTALTGLAPDFAISRWFTVPSAFILVRFLVGACEAGNSPNGNKFVSNWMGSQQRAIGSSFTMVGIGIGGTITPPLIAWVMQYWGWRSTFYVSGLLGLVVVLFWEWYVTNTPEEHTGVNAEELALIHDISQLRRKETGALSRTPWRKLLSNVSVWGLLLGYFCQAYPIYFFHTWFFIYLIRVRHLSISEGGIWGAAPYMAIVLLAPLGGYFSDFMGRTLGKRNGRRLSVCCGMFLSSLFLWIGSASASRISAILFLSAAAGLNMFAAASFWATCIDLTETFAGSLSGLMNTFGNTGGLLSPILTAYVATHISWSRAIDCASIASVLSGLCFFIVQADKNIDSTLTNSQYGTGSGKLYHAASRPESFGW